MSPFTNTKGVRAHKSGVAQEAAVWVRTSLFERPEQKTHEERVEELLWASYCEQKKSRELLQRQEYLMELVADRLNHLEWRSFLEFESKWSGLSLQSAFKAWKHGAASVPSRDGEDRMGYAGSPMDEHDQRRADEELPDERIWEKLASMPPWIYGEQHIADKRAHRAYWLARTARADAAFREKRALAELSKEQRRALKSEPFWQRDRRPSLAEASLDSIDEQEQAPEAAAAAEQEQAEPEAAAAAELDEQQETKGLWRKCEL